MAEPQQKNVRSKPTAADKSRKLGWKFGVGTGAATAALLAAILFRTCSGEPQVEPIQQNCPEAVVCPAAPVKGDNNCELDKGEHDMWSPNWDPASCGYCGDGEQQSWESPETCPVDFHCGDGELQRRSTVFGAVVRTGEGENEVYSLGTIELSESCNERADNYCQDDCPTTGRRPERTGRRDHDRPNPSGTTATADRPPRSGGACSDRVRRGASAVYARISSQVSTSSGSIRSALGVENVPVTISVSVNVSASGTTSVAGASARCGGGRCPNSANIRSIAGLDLQGITIANQDGSACTLSVPASLR